MALFSQTGRDADIPLLTQVFQLEFDRNGDTDDRKELIEFTLRHMPLLNPAERETWRSMWQQMPVVVESRFIFFFDTLADICRLTRRMMTTLTREKPYFDYDDLHALKKYKQNSDLWPIPDLEIDIPDNAPQWRSGDHIPIELVSPALLHYPISNLAGIIIDALWRFISDREAIRLLKICPVCNNVFESNPKRRMQIYCSHRCSSLEGYRRSKQSTKVAKGDNDASTIASKKDSNLYDIA